MNVHMDPSTEKKLNEYMGARPGYFKLFYDTEDCGCNGVLTLQIIDQPLDTDIKVEADAFELFVDRQQQSLFDHTMKIIADPNYPSFTVRSDSSLFSSNVRIRDLRQN